MKFKKLIVENFQSLKDIEINFEENGVYRFAGLNNTGKSSVLKAMSVLLRNVSNNQYKSYIRDNEDTFVIMGYDFKGNYVKLSRGAVDFYEWKINGKEGRMDKTGGKVPLEVEKFVNLYIEKEKTKECLNIRLAREILLFIDTTKGDNSMMFQKALGTEEYILGMKEVDKRGREINKEVKLLEQYLGKENIKLEEVNKELLKAENTVEEIERYEDILRKEYLEYQLVKDLIETTEEFLQSSKELKVKKDILNKLEFNEVKGNLEVLKKMTELISEQEKYDKTSKELEEKKAILAEVDLRNIKSDLEVLSKLQDVKKLFEKGIEESKVLKEKKAEKAEIAKELEDFKAELKICPFCQQEMGEEHVH